MVVTPLIRVRGVSRLYGTRLVLRDVSLDIGPGERVALVGPNGSGKTTLMRVILGLLRASGEVRVAGVDPWADHAMALRHVAWVPQRSPALAAPVREICGAWAQMRGRPVEALEKVTAAFGLDVRAIADQPFTSLSGGMQQKLLVATALASTCPVLLMDEPTANLDPAARDVFFELLAARDPAPTLVLSSHRLEEVRALVDRVVVLAEGEVRFDDATDIFLTRPAATRLAGLHTAADHPQPGNAP